MYCILLKVFITCIFLVLTVFFLGFGIIINPRDLGGGFSWCCPVFLRKLPAPWGLLGRMQGLLGRQVFIAGWGGEVVGRMGGALSAVCHELDRFPRKRLCAHFALIASVTK